MADAPDLGSGVSDVQVQVLYLEGPPRRSEAQGGRYTRRLLLPRNVAASEEAGRAIAGYVALFDACLKTFFDHLEDPAGAPRAVEGCYRSGLDAETAAL